MFCTQLSNNCSVKNRLALAPMTNSQSNPDGTVSSADLAWYERVARDDVGGCRTEIMS